MKRIFILLLGVCFFANGYAQPQKRRVAQKEQQKQITDRVALQFPAATDMPEDMVWKRDVFRQLDLTQDKNAPIYYPVEPQGREINLFTLMFRLMLDGKIPVYEYGLDGNVSFAEKDRIKPKEFLEKYQIYYEMNGDRIMVNNSDIPSREVKRMYMKESVYFDQRTSSFHKKVTALCPVLVRDDDFGAAATPYPLFWVNYKDVASYFARHAMMSSNYNNVSNMTADDYFSMNRYDGKIYKTTNMQGLALANYCKTDSALVKEQKRIEQQLVDVERFVWGKLEQPKDSADTVKVETKEKKARAARSTRTSRRPTRSQSSSKSKSSVKSKSSRGQKSSSSSTPRVTVRRQRR